MASPRVVAAFVLCLALVASASAAPLQRPARRLLQPEGWLGGPSTMTVMGINPAATPVYEPWMHDQSAGTYAASTSESSAVTNFVDSDGTPFPDDSSAWPSG